MSIYSPLNRSVISLKGIIPHVVRTGNLIRLVKKTYFHAPLFTSASYMICSEKKCQYINAFSRIIHFLYASFKLSLLSGEEMLSSQNKKCMHPFFY